MGSSEHSTINPFYYLGSPDPRHHSPEVQQSRPPPQHRPAKHALGGPALPGRKQLASLPAVSVAEPHLSHAWSAARRRLPPGSYTWLGARLATQPPGSGSGVQHTPALWGAATPLQGLAKQKGQGSKGGRRRGENPLLLFSKKSSEGKAERLLLFHPLRYSPPPSLQQGVLLSESRLSRDCVSFLGGPESRKENQSSSVPCFSSWNSGPRTKSNQTYHSLLGFKQRN